jgi:hypothetical protein
MSQRLPHGEKNTKLTQVKEGVACTSREQFFELFYAFAGALLLNWLAISCRAR